MSEPEWIRPREAARLLGMSKGHVYRIIHNGNLPAVQHKGYKGHKGSILIKKSDVYEYRRTYYERIYPKTFCLT